MPERSPRILLVDDEQAIQTLVKELEDVLLLLNRPD